jgi:hypothetical protein
LSCLILAHACLFARSPARPLTHSLPACHALLRYILWLCYSRVHKGTHVRGYAGVRRLVLCYHIVFAEAGAERERVG